MPKNGSNTAKLLEPPTLFVIEDKRTEREFLTRLLIDEGFSVLAFDSGTAAVREIARLGKAGVVLTDNEMPNDSMGGLAAAHKIQELDPTASIVFLSGSVGMPEFHKRVEALGIRVDGWFEKGSWWRESKLIERLHLEEDKVRIRRFLVEAESSRGIEPLLALDILALWEPKAQEVYEELHKEFGAEILEPHIDQLYGELRELVPRSAKDPAAREAVARKREELRNLQKQEAMIARRRAESRLQLKPGQGYEALARAARLLAE